MFFWLILAGGNMKNKSNTVSKTKEIYIFTELFQTCTKPVAFYHVLPNNFFPFFQSHTRMLTLFHHVFTIISTPHILLKLTSNSDFLCDSLIQFLFLPFFQASYSFYSELCTNQSFSLIYSSSTVLPV